MTIYIVLSMNTYIHKSRIFFVTIYKFSGRVISRPIVYFIRISHSNVNYRRGRDNYRISRFLAAMIDRIERSLLHHQLSLLRLQLTDFADLFQGIDLKLIK